MPIWFMNFNCIQKKTPQSKPGMNPNNSMKNLI